MTVGICIASVIIDMDCLVHDTVPLVLNYAVQEQICGRKLAQSRYGLGTFGATEYPAG
jgi:hypothetical protein